MTITESYWKHNYKNFKLKNPTLSKYLKEDFNRNGYKSKLMKEMMMLNESNNMSKAEQILNSLEKSVKTDDLDGVVDSANELKKVIPDSAMNVKIPEEDIDNIYEALENSTENKNFKKQSYGFLNKIKRIAINIKRVIDDGLVQFIVLGYMLVIILDYLLSDRDSFIYEHNYQFSAMKFRNKLLNVLKYAIIFGVIYLIINLFASLLTVLFSSDDDNQFATVIVRI